jgi:hypothetical protein
VMWCWCSDVSWVWRILTSDAAVLLHNKRYDLLLHRDLLTGNINVRQPRMLNQCLQSVSTISVYNQCLQSVSTISVYNQCLQSVSTINKPRHLYYTTNALKYYNLPFSIFNFSNLLFLFLIFQTSFFYISFYLLFLFFNLPSFSILQSTFFFYF